MMSIKEEVLKHLEEGHSIRSTSREFGIPRSTIQNWMANPEKDPQYKYLVTPNVTGFVKDNVERNKTKEKLKGNKVLEFLENLAPIHYTQSSKSVKKCDASLAVVGSDFHFGCHDQKAIDIFLETISELNPRTVILNGDTMDFLAISRYPKDIKVNWSLLDERKAYHAFLSDLIGVCGKDVEIYETYSNHSGQSVGGRWRRYLSERIGELASLPEIADKLSYEEIFMGDYKNVVSHVDYVELNSLVVTHGDTVRKNGGYSARGEIEKWGCSILHGHTHRIGSTCQRIPAIGNRKEKQLYGFEGGCMCSLDAVYANHPNWQTGFSIVSLADDGVNFGLEQVLINNGKATISTLGKTISAS